MNFYSKGFRSRISAVVWRAGVILLSLLKFPFGFGAHNAALAAENMILQATELGLGSCYLASPTFSLNGPKNRDLAHRAGIPDGYAVQCGVIVGYAAAENKFILGERKPKGVVNYID
jgi:nitroreductase